MKRAAIILFAAFAATAAQSDGEVVSKMTAADKAKIAGYEATRAKAIAEARAGGSPADLAELDKALAGTPIPGHAMDPTGDWRCRVIKLGTRGGGPPLVVYPWYDCRFAEDDYSIRLEKLGGSQRTAGYFYGWDQMSVVYLGVLTLPGQPRQYYGRDPKRDQVAYMIWLSKDRLRMEFPQPEYESLLDVMEMVRK